MKTTLTLLFTTVFYLVSFGQDVIYQNTFDAKQEGENLLLNNEYKVEAYSNATVKRTISVVKEHGNKFLRFDIPGMDSKTEYNSLIRDMKKIHFHRGATYTITLKTRGPFERGLRLIDIKTMKAVVKGASFNAANDKDYSLEWHEHTLEYSPTDNFVGQIAILRNWNGVLDVDDIKVSTVSRIKNRYAQLPHEVYKCDFSVMTSSNVGEHFKFKAFQQEGLARSLSVNNQYGNSFLQLSIEETRQSANTIVFLKNEFQFKKGESYTISVKTRGKFKRQIKLLDVGNDESIISSNDAEASKNIAESDWFTHRISISPKYDFTGKIGILRLWYGDLDIDEIVIRSTDENNL
ncbi:hypothetical protein KMW28_18720 [Flammeovirga yaeyamensis]|uniref:CBM-cenC domain-containing protein n=1 Tax=Flammeovirga yaeyamensis TaxID=367791 RepID=A0AAX1N2E9_9BACT|nr:MULTISPECIES: hypothetical protein [Flammeovirga]ANQ50936.1 hypothetical protein MY04_3588 [Flammeovirga sp. MY04]MBB3701188.1 hypothetical protein [Flammeovirga yaeyamensis]NMF38486.1 hypothetical protein [Flammeovirga yaeyamensis]QWG01654.1 hypothetical protein KMW28_18720 [Flammeovirga yaeyamensis]